MPHDHRTSKADFPLDDAQRLRQQGHSYNKIAASIGWSIPQTRRYLLGKVTGNGNLPAIRATLQTAPDRTSAPDRTESALAQLDIRLQVVEAFISALPVPPKALALQSAPDRTEPPVWVSRGTDIAQDMRDAIDRYATEHRLEKRMALDELLRIAFAQVATEVHGDD